MPNRNLWNKIVPSVEYDHRARDIRLRLEHIERLLVKRDAVQSATHTVRLPRCWSALSYSGQLLTR